MVIASPGLSWMLEANAADVQLATVAAGYQAPDLPTPIPAERLAFDPHYARADYAIVDNLWFNWGVWNVPGAPDALAEIETWSLLLRTDTIAVYQNPNPEK